MYLLKHFTLLLLPASVSDLHSTMYLLKPIKSKFNDINIVDLHSTMYLLKLMTERQRVRFSSIYIPLCIY